jgi:hypothetical protein
MATETLVIPCEKRLDTDPDWALREGSGYFEDKGSVQGTVHRMTKRLDDLPMPYVVAGGIAMFRHGYRRFTEVVDLLVTRPALDAIHAAFVGLGSTGGIDRLKDFTDVVKLIKSLGLPRKFGQQLNGYVSGKFWERGDGLKSSARAVES